MSSADLCVYFQAIHHIHSEPCYNNLKVSWKLQTGVSRQSSSEALVRRTDNGARQRRLTTAGFFATDHAELDHRDRTRPAEATRLLLTASVVEALRLAACLDCLRSCCCCMRRFSAASSAGTNSASPPYTSGNTCAWTKIFSKHAWLQCLSNSETPSLTHCSSL